MPEYGTSFLLLEYDDKVICFACNAVVKFDDIRLTTNLGTTIVTYCFIYRVAAKNGTVFLVRLYFIKY